MANSGYGNGRTLFQSKDKITYGHEAGMEFINLEIARYRIERNKFVKPNDEPVEFSSEKYYGK